MATKAQQDKLIQMIAPIAVKAYEKFGKPLPSVTIAMCAIESAWGTAGSCKYNSYMGHKVGSGKTALTYWGGKSFNSKTKEFIEGQYIGINSNFRAYDSVEQCIFNFYELLNTPLYAGVSKTKDYRKQMAEIKRCGYMTSPTEVAEAIKIIEWHNLDVYDRKQSECFVIPTLQTVSIVDALASIHEGCSFDSRTLIAKANGITGYTGSATQNNNLLKLLYEGRLIKP